MQGRTPHTRFGRNLRAELDRQSISVRELSRRLNPSDPDSARRTIARWLTPLGEAAVKPSRASLLAVADALAVDPSELDDEDDDAMAALTRAVERVVSETVKKTLTQQFEAQRA